MKVVILAGGRGTRIAEESKLTPKPMIRIGEEPILWHIMKEYSHYGFNEFIICAGYKQQVIKEWFNNYMLYNSDITFDFSEDEKKIVVHKKNYEEWKVTIVDTGLDTLTGGRIKRVKEYLNNETFMMTYGDGVSDINIKKLLDFHKSHGKLATLTSFVIEQQKGVLKVDRHGTIKEFREKNIIDGSLINAGYMVLEPQVLDYIDGDETVFEKEPLERLVSAGQLAAYKHSGFWKCMDTMKDKEELESLWNGGQAKWKVW